MHELFIGYGIINNVISSPQQTDIYLAVGVCNREAKVKVFFFLKRKYISS